MLKSSYARAGLRQVALQLKHKEESGEDLSTVDFEKLNFQNEKLQTDLARCNTDLMVLKQVMNKFGYKRDRFASNIRRSTTQTTTLEDKIKSGHKHIAKTFREFCEVEAEKKVCAAQVQRYRQRLAQARVPSVASYINMKVDLDALTQAMPLWERRVDVIGKVCQKYKSMWVGKRRMRTEGSLYFDMPSRRGTASLAFGCGESSPKLPRKSRPSFKSINSIVAHRRFSEGAVAGVTQPINTQRKLPAIR
jgi:hypothetical protein